MIMEWEPGTSRRLTVAGGVLVFPLLATAAGITATAIAVKVVAGRALRRLSRDTAKGRPH